MKPQCPADISTFLGRCSDSRAWFGERIFLGVMFSQQNCSVQIVLNDHRNSSLSWNVNTVAYLLGFRGIWTLFSFYWLWDAKTFILLWEPCESDRKDLSDWYSCAFSVILLISPRTE
jgi:hypothetical protein